MLKTILHDVLSKVDFIAASGKADVHVIEMIALTGLSREFRTKWYVTFGTMGGALYH